jgi:hypothetical protein
MGAPAGLHPLMPSSGARHRWPSASIGLHPSRADVCARGAFFLAVMAVDDLVTVCRRRCDERALLTRFLLGLTVARLRGGVARRGRRTRPARSSSSQKCNRAAAANEAAHLSKYNQTLDHRQRPAGDAKSAQGASQRTLPAALHACVRQMHAPDVSGNRPIPDLKLRPPTFSPDPEASVPTPNIGLPTSHFGRQTVCDCRLSANRRGLGAPMAAFS